MNLLLDGIGEKALLSAGMPADACAAQWILEHPEPFLQRQKRAVAAGCDILAAPTGGANRIRLAPFGLEDRVQELNARLAALTKEAAAGKRVAGCLCPTGLVPEPYGEDGGGSPISELLAAYGEQAGALAKAGVDLLLARGMTSLNEARAALLACRETGLPVFVTFVVDEEGLAPSGTSLLPALITLQAMGAAAVGLEGVSPAVIAGQIREALPYAQIPLIAVPAAGDLSPLRFGEAMVDVMGAGASITGGCEVLPEHLAVLRGVMDKAPTIAAPEVDGHAAAGEQEAFFLSDDLEPSDPLPCDSNLADALIEAEDGCNVARVYVAEPEDIPVLLEAVRVCRLPLALYCDTPLVLDETLLRVPGRLLVDSLCEMEPALLEDIAAHYGAIVF